MKRYLTVLILPLVLGGPAMADELATCQSDVIELARKYDRMRRIGARALLPFLERWANEPGTDDITIRARHARDDLRQVYTRPNATEENYARDIKAGLFSTLESCSEEREFLEFRLGIADKAMSIFKQ